jgi:ribosomal protein S27E
MPAMHPRTGVVDVGRVDGNAAAGPLSELFCFDVTTATAECGHCGARALVAEAEAELDDEGVIVLCRSCGRTLLTYVHAPAGRTLVLDGLRSLAL